MTIRLAPLALVLLLTPLASTAQTDLDGSATPRQGTLRASSATPAVLDIQIAPEAENPVADCPGYFTLGAPDAVVDWEGGGSALRVWVRSALDGVLIVQAPTGETLCEDDTDGVQPAIQIGQAQAGRYAVWVGAFTPTTDASPAATLYAGPPPPEVSLQEPDASTARLEMEDSDLTLAEESRSMNTAVAALGLPDRCMGFIGMAPMAVVSGDGPYTVTASSSADLVLAIRTASGDWLCDDDSGPDKDPAVYITAAGEHTVWVGTFRGHARGEAPEAGLRVTRETVVEDQLPILPPPPPPAERVYFSEGSYTPIDLTSRGFPVPLATQSEMAQVNVTAMGETANPISGAACAGFIPESASATIEFGGAGPLTITAETQSGDLVMVAKTASGDWFCSDDASGQDPAIEIANPGGDVMVWVGTFSQGDEAPTVLTAHRAELIDVLPEEEQIYDDYLEIMEDGVASYSSGTYSGSGLSPEADAPSLTLGAESSVGVGGTVSTPVSGDACAGFISAAPSAVVAAGDGTLAFYASGEEDLTMTVRTPNGDWFCSDDHIGLDPGIEVSSGGDGMYAIWLGTFTPLQTPSAARLIVEEGPLRSTR